MNCPRCRAPNPEGAKFCNQCGSRIEAECPHCGRVNPPASKFCNECGHRLAELRPSESEEPTPKTEPSSATGSERKHATVLFSDLSGYTAISESLDPEEVKEIVGTIFGQAAQVVAKYEGFLDKFIGDAVMAIFGVPQAHEDDPIRAIMAAKEIHQLVEDLSPQVEERIGRPLAMHTGINTGLVITGDLEADKGRQAITGDTVNLASRLTNLAQAGEIIVGPETRRQAKGCFTFEALDPTRVKGKAKLVQAYKVLAPAPKSRLTRRSPGLRADLIGRDAELAQLGQAAAALSAGQGAVFAIVGEAGTGKTRLVEEFKATLDPAKAQWVEGQAHAYTQSTPYYPLLDLLSQVFQIEERDPAKRVEEKIASGVVALGAEEEIVPYLTSLYLPHFAEAELGSPEFWKARLQEAVLAVFSGLAQRAPTIICLEDLHWADPSSIDCLRFVLSEFRQAALLLCLHRPHFSLFTSHHLAGLGETYHEIQLHDLSFFQTQEMVESLLQTETLPAELQRFIQEQVEGNPFFLEEVINALIESGTLSLDSGGWEVTRPISASDIPSTIHGLISARLDRLERETKLIVQEASVIGRSFLYEILKRITELKSQIDRSLSGLERVDLIQVRAVEPDLEYVFKQTLTQEVVYNGLLKKDRQQIHERIGLAMEELYDHRLSEFYEALALHFKEGLSTLKAVDYMIKSGEKSLRRYAVEESHQYFKEAFDLLTDGADRTGESDALLIDLIVKWALVFYYRGDFKGLADLLSAHQEIAESQADKALLGMFYGWLGFSVFNRAQYADSYRLLLQALKIGQETGEQRLIGYACTWLSWTCAEMGSFDEAISFGERGQEVARLIPADQYLYFKSLGGIGFACCHKGDRERAIETGQAILDYGQRHSNVRSIVLGHWIKGFTYLNDHDLAAAIECNQKAIQSAVDPYYRKFSELILGMAYCLNGQFQEGEAALKEVESFSQAFGCEQMGQVARVTLGMVSMALGRLGQGLKMVEEWVAACAQTERKSVQAMFECRLAEVYLRIVDKKTSLSLPALAKNVGFVLKNVPSAAKKAEDHFNKALSVAQEIRAKGTQAQACLGLGLLYKTRGKADQAKEFLSQAVHLFEQCGSKSYLKQARQELTSLG